MAYTQEQTDGITKARLVCNLERAADEQFEDNDSYIAWVCQMAGLDTLPEYAIKSYVQQHEAVTVPELIVEVQEHLAEALPLPSK